MAKVKNPRQLTIGWTPSELALAPHNKDACKTRRAMVDAMLRADPGRFGHLERFRYCKYCNPPPNLEIWKWREQERRELVELERNRLPLDPNVPRGTRRTRRSRN